MEDLKERIKNRIAENRQLMVTAKFPHIYYQAVGTRKLEQILEEEFEREHKESERKALLSGELLIEWKCKACGYITFQSLAAFRLCPNCGRKILYEETKEYEHQKRGST